MRDFSLTSVAVRLPSHSLFLQFGKAIVPGWVNASRETVVLRIITTHAPHNTNSKNDEQMKQHKNKESESSITIRTAMAGNSSWNA